MYIHPFVAGVLSTLFFEMALYIIRDTARKVHARNMAMRKR